MSATVQQFWGHCYLSVHVPGPKTYSLLTMSGLEELGIPGSEQLAEALTVSAKPERAIADFQEHNRILLPSLRPAMPFLDLHGVKRLDFHMSTLEEMRERLIKRVEELAASGREEDVKIMEDLLEKSFPVVKVKNIRPVVLSILEHLPQIEEHYLVKILADEELFRDTAVPVKRQIWQDRSVVSVWFKFKQEFIQDKIRIL